MTDPDYAINFINITTQIIATILGFTIIFWVFWYENIGKNLKLELGKKLKGFRLIKFYNKFERDFLNNFLKGKIPFTRIAYEDIFRIAGLALLYVKIKNKTKDKMFKYTRKIINYHVVISLYLFMALIGVGVNTILENVRILFTITKFSEEQLTQDLTLPRIINKSFENFNVFILIFFIYIFVILAYTMIEYKKVNQKKSDIK